MRIRDLTSSRAFNAIKPRRVLALGVILLVAWLIVESPLFHKIPPAGVQLTDLHSVDQLQARFNADTGIPRLILVLSPT